MRHNSFKACVSMSLVILICITCVMLPASSASISDENIYEEKISPDLQTRLDKMDADDKVKVAIWLYDIDSKVKDSAYTNKLQKEKNKGKISKELYSEYISLQKNIAPKSQQLSLTEMQTLSSIKRSSQKELHMERNAKWKDSVNKIAESSKVIYTSVYAPVLFLEISKSDLSKIVLSAEVEYIYLWNEEQEPTDIDKQSKQKLIDTGSADYGVWQNITNIYTMRNVMGYDGNGIKIGVLELGVPDIIYGDVLSNSDITIVNNASTSDHATNTAAILAGSIDNYTGVVPNASLYCAGYDNGYIKPIEALISNDINILSISNTLSAFPANAYANWSKYMDYIVYNYNITVCIASNNDGNAIEGVPASAMAYNVITVGNLDDKNTLTYNDDYIDLTSCYVSSNTEAYKPDICAPGSRVGTPIHPERIIDGRGGTSSATPIVSGICALLMQADPSLIARPMLVKSILMSSAKRVPNMDSATSTAITTAPALSRRYGAGLVNATRAFAIADEEKWDYIPLVTADQSQNPYVVNMNVSQNAINSSKKLAVSLSWTQKVLSTSLSNSTVYDVYHHDLGVYDPNGNLVAYSNYLYDRKQFVYFQPTVAGTYQIKVYKTGTAQAGVLTAISYNLA